LYENVSGTWTQIGKDIEGGVNFDRSGEFVSLSSDGNTVAIGAPGSFVQVPAVGGQRVYKNVSGTWTQIGSDIAGGGPVSLSSDGSIVAIGSPRSWRVKLYENVSGTWTQIGSDIRGKVPGAADGASVSLSSDGSIVAIGAPALNQNSPGHVKVYENENSNVGIDPSLEKPFIQVYPNPTTNEINITVAPSLVGTSYTLCNSNGQSIQEGTIESISTLLKLDSFPEGVYLLQIGNNLKQTFRVIKE
jgi:Flp pilus assembly pilin Flp